jgi:vitamin B12 transporter
MMVCNYRLTLFIVMVVFLHKVSSAQLQDTVNLIPVQITAPRSLLFTAGTSVWKIDSVTLEKNTHRSLADLLNSNSVLFVKTYGGGASATLSIRGTEPRHSAIIWKGFNINSPTLGLSDLSLIPVASSNSVSVTTGGYGVLYGNSALGGVVELHSHSPSFKQQQLYQLAGSTGSFGQYAGSGSVAAGNEWVESRTNIFYQQAENNFTFRNIAKKGSPVDTLQHAATKNYGIMQDLFFSWSPHVVLNIAAWYQVMKRQIPPMMTVPQSTAEQRDSILRITTSFAHTFDQSKLEIKFAWFDEYQYFDDPRYKIFSRYHSKTWKSELEWQQVISSSVLLSGGIQGEIAAASFAEYNGLRKRKIGGIFINSRITPVKNWLINAGVRKDFTESENPPVIPYLAIEGVLWKDVLMVMARGGRHYNLPTMNDLYWIPGGNVNLKPEDAWSGDFGLSLFPAHRFLPKGSVTVYRSYVSNWIVWRPGAAGYYSPENIRTVSTRGIEFSLTKNISLKKIQILLHGAVSRGESIMVKSNDEFEKEFEGNQLALIPVDKYLIRGELKIRRWSVYTNFSYTGERYTTLDHVESLEPYYLLDLGLSKEIRLGSHNLDLQAGVENMTSYEYQVLPYRPSPGRTFRIDLRWKFKRK